VPYGLDVHLDLFSDKVGPSMCVCEDLLHLRGMSRFVQMTYIHKSYRVGSVPVDPPHTA
jgi:hypothetical protein